MADAFQPNFPDPRLSPNYSLIGLPGSRLRLATPALVVDLDILDRNIARMAEAARAKGIGLRPHAKTHKCAAIAKRQLEAGALGICCAKLGEAEALAAAGIDRLLLTSPVVTQHGMSRLFDLNHRVEELIVVVDNPSVAVDLDAMGGTFEGTLKVLIDLDIGLHRTGIQPGAQAMSLALMIDQAPNLELMGLQGYAGHLMHLETAAERREKSADALRLMAEMRDALVGEGIACTILSGGGTGTAECDPDAGILTELQVGSYVFMDRQYMDIGYEGDRFDPSLVVQMTVISANVPGIATTDTGFKSFATDDGVPVLTEGAPEGASFFFFGDEQGGIALPDGARMTVGDRLSALVPHCDPTVNLYDYLHVVQGDRLVDIWQIEGRGKST